MGAFQGVYSQSLELVPNSTDFTGESRTVEILRDLENVTESSDLNRLVGELDKLQVEGLVNVATHFQGGSSTGKSALLAGSLVRKTVNKEAEVLYFLGKSLGEANTRTRALLYLDTLSTRVSDEGKIQIITSLNALGSNKLQNLENRIRFTKLKGELLSNRKLSGNSIEQVQTECQLNFDRIKVDSEHPELKRAALKSARVLECPGLVPLLREIVSDDSSKAPPVALQTAAIKALGDYQYADDVSIIGPHLKSENEYAHATAARALSKIKGHDALVKLVEHEGRFGGIYVAAAIATSSDSVFNALQSNISKDVEVGVKASVFLYNPGPGQLV